MASEQNVAPDKFAIANALREISLLLALKGENPYKSRAYANGAAVVEEINDDIGKVIAENRLIRLRGIGQTLAAQIVEMYRSGYSPMLERLRNQLPPGVIELSQVPGLSVKKIQALHEALGVTSVPELEKACREGRVCAVTGFGKKTEQNILQGIRIYETGESTQLLLHGRELASRVKQHLESEDRSGHYEVAGSIRRWKETVSNVNMVARSAHAEKAIAALTSFPLVTRVERPAKNRAVARLSTGEKIHLRTSTAAEFPLALLHETGSKDHLAVLRELALQRGYNLTASEFRKGTTKVKIRSEADVYYHLGLPFIPPELRESVDDLAAAIAGDEFLDLIAMEDIQGMTHCHTVYSDGKNSVQQMANAAEALGMKYITITDHSPAAHYAGGVDLERLKRQWEEIDKAQEKVNLKILRGTESDILEDGSLDYPDSILDKFDVIIASIHSRMKMDSREMTRRIVNCMQKRQFKIWGHALGRLLLKREPFACDVEAILDVIAESNAAIEVNGDPYRLDMEPQWIRQARKRGIPFVISVDAHSTDALNYLPYGVHIARRGGLRKSEVLNTLSARDFARKVRPA